MGIDFVFVFSFQIQFEIEFEISISILYSKSNVGNRLALCLFYEGRRGGGRNIYFTLFQLDYK